MVEVLLQQYALQAFRMDSFFEIVEGLIAFFIGFYAHKIYKITSQKKYLFFTWAFYFMALSFFLAAFLNFISYEEWLASIGTGIKISMISSLSRVGYFVHVLLLTLGFTTLAILSFDLSDKRVISLIYIITAIALLASVHINLVFHFIALIFLSFILPYFRENCKKTKHNNSRTVYYSFVLLFFSHIAFFFVLFMPLFYFIGHFLQLAGFTLLLISFIKILRK